MRSVILKPGKEKSLLQRHPWIFSGAVSRAPEMSPGEVLSVFSSTKQFLAKAYFNPTSSLFGRVLTFIDEPVEKAIRRKIREAKALRSLLNLPHAYRLVNGEGDGLPGLIVDCYKDVVVLQVHTMGMEKLKSLIVDILREEILPRTIYEKSQSSARRLDSLEDAEGFLWGEEIDLVEIEEHGVRYWVSLKDGQKSGFFLDQREMRKKILLHAKGKRVLNCFSYTGGFALSALQGGAIFAESVDSSKKALELAEKNSKLNGFSNEQHALVCQDLFEYLKRPKLDFDLVILDPPAFIKKRNDLLQGCKGYQEINQRVLEKIPPRSFLFTASCSYYLDEPLFQKLIFQAAYAARRSVQILSRHIQAEDHPISIYHPEGSYLKSLFLYVE